ncbi:MAG: hypothetical protein K1X29_07815 [Bdellovibrionales bacterium]|nr:hypothetical protein [Bdellovibrionales bacterium]
MKLWCGRDLCINTAFLLLIVIVVNGCAYRLGLGERSLPGGYRQLAIPVFKNKTQEVGLEVDFTNALIREFERSKVAEVVPLDAATIKLEGEISSLKVESRSAALGTNGDNGEISALPSDVVLTTSYRLVVTINLNLIRMSDQSILWSGRVSNEKVYSAPRIGSQVVNSANTTYNQSARQINTISLAKEMMQEVHGRMTENF